MTDRIRYLVTILAVAVAYFGTGRMGLALAIPPGYATAVWPPSGIALAAVLLAGIRVWPGVLLGSFLVNISTGFDAGTADTLLRSLAIPIAITSGASLQAVSGGILVMRFGSFPNPLRTVPQIVGLLGLGGAAGCVINASVSVITLFAAGQVPLADVPFTWMTWWGGDTIGVFVFTPLVLALLMRPREEWKRRWAVVVTASATTFALVVVLVAYTSNLERKEFDAQLSDKGEDLRAALKMTVAARLQAVDALQAFLSHSDAITVGEFARFSSTLRSQIPGVLALEWIPRVTSEQRPAFEAWAQTERLADFHITENGSSGLSPAGLRSEYFPVFFVDPHGGNKRAVGFDLASNDERRAALDRARSTGTVSVTGRITLVQGGNAVLAVVPVDRGRTDDSRSQRQDRLAGFALGVLRLDDLAETAFHGRDTLDLNYWLVDQTVPDSPVILSANTDQAPATFNLVERGLFGRSGTLGYEHQLDVGGRLWGLRIAPTQAFIAKHRPQNAWFVLVGGLLAAGMMGAFTMVVTGREGELRALVDARTAELRHSEDKLVAAQRIAHLGSWSLDLTSNVLTWSDEAYRIFGIAPKQFEASYEAFMESVHADDRAYVDQQYRGALKGMHPYDIDHRIVRRNDGAVRWVHETCEHLRNEAGEVVRSDGTVHDITERKRLEEELKRSNAELEQFAYVASHDLRQPLRMVSSYIGLISKKLSERLDDEDRTFIGFAVDGAKRMDRMIIDLLDYSRIGRDASDKGNVSLAKVLSRSIGNLEVAIAEAGAEIEVQSVLPVIVGYESELERLFQNLIGNAIKFREPDRMPKVTIECQETARDWIFAVTDNGIGIEPEDHAHLFVVFQRLVSHEQYQGTGIGLAACRKIAEHHGGRIWVESELGKGCTFRVALPKGDAYMAQ